MEREITMKIVPAHARLTHVGDARLVHRTVNMLSLLLLEASCVFYVIVCS